MAFAAAIVLHAWVAGHTGLSGDEAHYLLYARHLDWSYFDHPPLVGWVQAPLVALTTDASLLRVLPQLVWMLTGLLLWRLTMVVSASRPAAAWALILFSSSPVLQIHGLAMIPDTLLSLWAVAGALLAVRISQGFMHGGESASGRWVHWLGLGAVLGLAGLSKYSAVFLGAGLACFLILAWWRGRGLGRRWPWGPVAGAILLAAVLVSPVFIWNAANDWISFRYQGGHVSGGSWQLQNVFIFGLGQVVGFGVPAAMGLIVFLAGRGVRPPDMARPQAGLLLVSGLFLLVLGYLAGGGRSLPYWTSPGWVIALVFAGVGLVAAAQWVRVVATLLALGYGCLFAFLAVSLAAGSMAGSTQAAAAQAFDQRARVLPNPFADVHGWDRLGSELKRLTEQPGAPQVAAVGNWTLASRVGWYAWPIPVWVQDSRFDQFDIWWALANRSSPENSRSNEFGGEGFLFVEWSELQTRKHLNDHMRCGAPVKRLEISAPGGIHSQKSEGVLSVFEIYKCRGNLNLK